MNWLENRGWGLGKNSIFIPSFPGIIPRGELACNRAELEL